MAKKKIKHTTFRNSDFFCLHCGGSQKIPYPIEIPMITAMADAFNKMHANCDPVWKEPEVDQSLFEMEKANWWLTYGERGMSAESIFQVISGRPIRHNLTHPCDPGDFHRCYKLLKTVPEWRPRLHKMRTVSPVWDKLVDNWDKLTELLEEQMVTKKDNGMSELMKQLGC